MPDLDHRIAERVNARLDEHPAGSLYWLLRPPKNGPEFLLLVVEQVGVMSKAALTNDQWTLFNGFLIVAALCTRAAEKMLRSQPQTHTMRATDSEGAS